MQHISVVIKRILNRLGFFLVNGLVATLMCCISPFSPEINEQTNLLSVDGSLVKGREIQTICISKASSISQPEFIPVEKCVVKVADGTGNTVDFQEISSGIYTAKTDEAFLTFNSQYKLILNTPDGNAYESEFQTLLETPPVDSFYCLTENHYSASTNAETSEGLQFYVDIDAPADASRFYRWTLEETWEIHAQYKISGYYDGENVHFFPVVSDSLFVCWKTTDVTGLYVSSTSPLIQNKKKKIPLFFVDSGSKKLWIRYCATISQYALNDDAHEYWQQKSSELYESGNIYAGQPSQSISNIHNINNPDQPVLGFFWVASVSLNHLFLKDPFHKYKEPICSEFNIALWYAENEEQRDSLLCRFFKVNSSYLPVPPFYFYENQFGIFGTTLEKKCMDCTAGGGTNQKPGFWE